MFREWLLAQAADDAPPENSWFLGDEKWQNTHLMAPIAIQDSRSGPDATVVRW
jgi:hypothetical protein